MNFKSLKKYLFSKYKRVFVDFIIEENLKLNKHVDFIFEKFHEKDMNLLKTSLLERDFISDFSINDVANRLNKGFFLYVVKKENRIIGYEWCAINKFYINYLGAHIILKKHEAYSIFHYIQQDFRGLGLANSLHLFSYNDLKRYGYDRVIGDYSPSNQTTIKAISKFKWNIIGDVTHGYIGTLNFLVNRVPKDKLTLDYTPFVFWKKFYNKKIKKIFSFFSF